MLDHPNLRHLDDLSDGRLDPFRDVRDRDLMGRHGLFMLEGRVVLEAVLDHGLRYPLTAVLVSDARVSRYRDVLERVGPEVPVYIVPEAVMFDVVGFPIHRGLLAAARRPAARSPAELLAGLGPGRKTVLVLEGLTNHDNVGACFRNAAAFGVDAVLLDATCCDPLYRKAVRVSVGHALAIPWARGADVGELLTALGAAGFTSCALDLGADAAPLDARRRPAERLAVLLGSEGPGLTRAAIEGADVRLRIPMAGAVDSLNVATAGAVALFALTA